MVDGSSALPSRQFGMGHDVLLRWLEMQRFSLSLPSHLAGRVLVECHAAFVKGTQKF